MAPHIEPDELTAAWRALGGPRETSGWQTIAVAADNPCKILAGRHFPGNEEAILVGFHAETEGPDHNLPVGRGFIVQRETVEGMREGRVWYSLLRQPSGNLEMFTKMAADIIRALGTHESLNQRGLLQLFLQRIRAWQAFMQRSSDHVLGPEAELGLVGELLFIQDLLGTNLLPHDAVEAWRGPLDEVHDFQLGGGSFEVKATLEKGRFPVSISSLEQLDDSLRHPLFLVATRLELNANGSTLPEFVKQIREMLRGERGAAFLFDTRLLNAGYLDLMAGHYTRRFHPVEKRIMRVRNSFPRILREMVSKAVLDAHYRIDLDLVSSSDDVELVQALHLLGVI